MRINVFFSNTANSMRSRGGISLSLSLIFSLYNLAVGIAFKLLWNFSVSFYYMLLTLIKYVILRKQDPRRNVSPRRHIFFRIENILLLMTDISLIAPIALMILQKTTPVNMGMIPTIAMAAYTTYKITMACINYKRSEKAGIYTFRILRAISLKEAIVSIITLQNTMIFVFGDPADMKSVTVWTSIGMYVSLIAISVFQFIKLRDCNDLDRASEKNDLTDL